MGMRRAVVVVAVVACVLIAWRALPARDPAAAALRAHVEMPPKNEQLYPRYAEVLRERGWLRSAAGMPDGLDPFAALPDAVLGGERVVGPGELHVSLDLIRGLSYDAATDAWIGAEGRSVPRARILELLKAALPTPRDAMAVAALLSGTANPGCAELQARFQHGADGLRTIRLRPFAGERGLLLVDQGRPPFRQREEGYDGYLASFDGDGWPSGWRVLLLQRR